MTMRLGVLAVSIVAASLVAGTALLQAEPMARGAARFDAKGNLVFPADYRHWTYLSSGFGMSYNAVANAQANPPFDNVFVDPASEQAFRKTGHWPDGTVMVLEVRGSNSKGSINLHGSYQAETPVRIELHVRDSKRFKGGWGFFDVDEKQATALIPYTANCYSCHQQHAAVDTTFVQFYPTLLPIAEAKGTLSTAYKFEEAVGTP